MHAIRVHEGAALVYEEVPDPEPKPGEAVVELKAAGLNRRDLLVRSGIYPFPLPLIPGSDGAGIRRDTGGGRDLLRVGSAPSSFARSILSSEDDVTRTRAPAWTASCTTNVDTP